MLYRPGAAALAPRPSWLSLRGPCPCRRSSSSCATSRGVPGSRRVPPRRHVRARGRAVVEAPASSAGVAGAAPSPARWEVVLARGGGGVVGRFGVGVPGGRQEVREVVERGCEEVVDALALVAAMTLVEAPEPGPEPEPGPLVPTPSGAPPSASDRADAARAPDRAEGAEHRAIAPFVAVGRGRLSGREPRRRGRRRRRVRRGRRAPRRARAVRAAWCCARRRRRSSRRTAVGVFLVGDVDACPARVRRTPLGSRRARLGRGPRGGTRVVPARSRRGRGRRSARCSRGARRGGRPARVAVEGASAPWPDHLRAGLRPVHEPPAVAGFVGAGADVWFP